MSENTVLYEVHGGVAKVTLNRPQALNSFTRRMHHDLWAALDQAEANDSVRALVITGAGRGFCAGADLAEFDFAEGPNLVERADPGPVIDQAFNPTTRRLQQLRMPTIAAVNGVAAGAGASLVMTCDIAIAARQHETGHRQRIERKFAQNEANFPGFDVFFLQFRPDIGMECRTMGAGQRGIFIDRDLGLLIAQTDIAQGTGHRQRLGAEFWIRFHRCPA